MKILNLYAGIGGNRKLWEGVEVTAVEYDAEIARAYERFYPDDKIIVADAHDYLLQHYSEFEFIWSSPPCPTHSKLRTMQKDNVVYPDMTLYQEIILLQKWFKGLYVVENVIPYYEPLIRPNMELHRHFFWCNFRIEKADFEKMETCKKRKEREFLQDKLGFDVSEYSFDHRKVLRNCVLPDLGLHILNCAMKKASSYMAQSNLFTEAVAP